MNTCTKAGTTYIEFTDCVTKRVNGIQFLPHIFMGTFNDQDSSYAPFYTMLICFVVFVIFAVYAVLRLIVYLVSTFTSVKTCEDAFPCCCHTNTNNSARSERIRKRNSTICWVSLQAVFCWLGFFIMCVSMISCHSFHTSETFMATTPSNAYAQIVIELAGRNVINKDDYMCPLPGRCILDETSPYNCECKFGTNTRQMYISMN